MLVWGSKYVKKTVGAGHFYCPSCRETTEYRQVEAKRYGHA